MGNKTYVGLDFHKNSSELCFMSEQGVIEDRVRVKTERLCEFLSNKKTLQIGVETSGGTFDICSRLEQLGHQVSLINASQFRAIGVTGKKNDRNDAEAIATVLRLGFIPEVHKKTLYSRRLKSLLASRELVVRTRVQLTNHIRGILREYGIVMPAGSGAFWEEVSACLGKLDCDLMREILTALKEQAEALKEKESAIETALVKLVGDDERVNRLQSIPGVGLLTACAIVACIDDKSRFNRTKKVGSYFGLVPREHSSGDKKRFGGITKAGPEMARRYLIHGARTLMKYPPKKGDRIRSWAWKLEKRAGFNKAVVALAHKNLRICFALLRDETEFGKRKTSTEKKAA